MLPCTIRMRICTARSWRLFEVSSLSRNYANRPASRLGRFGGELPSLDHFLQRERAIKLWREILRGCRQVSDPNTKKETLDFAKEEFRRNKDVKDLTQIRYLISTGKTQWETFERYISGL
ncbi:hypothetical protein B0J14DRAFT_74765 [Halenospora varia]|nr:hypothetical protein B0J14DRAFT_74765 [Halenospora varia]